MNVVPGQNIYVAYVIPNPGDNNVYYPQAVAKNTATGAVIAIVNLVQDANQKLRYTGSFIAPADPTGLGYYIDVLTTPYTDNGHTTPSAMYGVATNQYLALAPLSSYSGPGGDSFIVDYARIEALIAERIAGIEFPEQKSFEMPEFPAFPEMKDVDLEPVLLNLKGITETLVGMQTWLEMKPDPEPLDLTPLHDRVQKVHDALSESIESHRREFKGSMKVLENNANRRHREAVDSLGESVQSAVSENLENGLPVRFMSNDKPAKSVVTKPDLREVFGKLNRKKQE